MIVAIDFDGTLTADAELWLNFIYTARRLGHRVICVTARRMTEENIDDIESWMSDNGIDLPVYYTGLASKVDHMSKLGIKVDIWVDDDPVRCATGH